jgi:ABC-type cobalamin/Fe3+-siderophores transport system ATPase subunit
MDDKVNVYNQIIMLINKHNNAYDDYLKLFDDYVNPNTEKIKEWFSQIRIDYSTNDVSSSLLKENQNKQLVQSIKQQNEQFRISVSDINTISVSYLTLLLNTLNSYNVLHQLPSWIESIRLSFEQLQKDPLNFNAKNTIVNLLLMIFSNTEKFTTECALKNSQLINFDYFKNNDKNIVIIGANGSGKSSFARNTKQLLGDNIAIIAAQKIFSFQKIDSVTLGKMSRESLWNFQRDNKLYKDNSFTSLIEHDLQTVFKSLVEEQNDSANQYFEKDRTSHIAERSITTLEKVIHIWHEILLHRELQYSEGDLVVLTQHGNKYPFMQLSDGEKAVFYYIAHVLLAHKDSFIIVDEPENHLHLALVAKLWDTLEQERSDCRFIYLTHNLDFAASRNNSEKIWMKNFTPPAYWEMQPLPTDEKLPEILYMELLGSRQPILFCEGTKDSLDYKLYTRVFPKYTIIPVQGHLQVISYTRAFNASTSIHGNQAIGIIDGDYHTQGEKNAWKKDSIYCLEVQEVENLLCDELLLKMVQERTGATDESIQEAKDNFFKDLSNHIDSQALDYATQRINEYFKSHMLERQKSTALLKTNLEKLQKLDDLNVDKLFEQRQTELRKILEERDYENGIKKYNNKGLIGISPLPILKEYKDRVFVILDQSSKILVAFRKKYFSFIPQEIIQESAHV